MRKSRYTILSAIIVAVMVIMSGCQAVGGADYSKAIISLFDIKSVEGNLKLTLNFSLDEDAALTADEKKSLELFKSFQGAELNLIELKMGEKQSFSMKGELVYAKGTIPLHLYMLDSKLIISADGLLQPIVIENPLSLIAPLAGFTDQIQSLTGLVPDPNQYIIKKLLGYLLGHLKMDQQVSVKQTEVNINNELNSLTQADFIVKGSDLHTMIANMAASVLEDTEGLKAVVSELFDLLITNSTEKLPPQFELMKNNKAFAINFMVGLIQEFLYPAIEGIQSGLGPEGEWGTYLNTQSSADLSIYMDDNDIMRKSQMLLTLEGTGIEPKGVKALFVQIDHEFWNVNGTVEVNKLTPIQSKIMGIMTKPYEILMQVNAESTLYKMLKDDLGITKKNIALEMRTSNRPETGEIRPFIKGTGTTMVPARFVVERLDAIVSWDPVKYEVTVKDEFTGTVIILKIGSKEATVNGQVKILAEEAELVNDTTFVPVRFITENLGGDITWDETTKTVTIQRD